MLRTLPSLLALAGFLIARGASADAAPIRILLLGDSITQGGFGQASYREPLIRLLRGENVNGANPTNTTYAFELVGTLSTVAGLPLSPANSAFPTSLALHPQHEGHYGWRTDEILEGDGPDVAGTAGSGRLADWLAGYTADIALVHLGTNDAIQDVDNPSPSFVADSWNELTSVLDVLVADNPSCSLFLAEIIPLHGAGNAFWSQAEGRVELLRQQIVAQADSTAATLVRFPGFDASVLTDDRIHPNAAGAAAMAAAWFTAMKPTLDFLSLSPVEQWRQTHFGSPADAGDGADLNDFDGDGVLNLMEWALGLHPKEPDAPALAPEVVGGFLTISVAKNPLATDVTFSAEAGPAPDALDSANVVVLEDSATRFTARDSVPAATAPARFVRLRVSR